MVENQPQQQPSQNMESKIDKNNNYHVTFFKSRTLRRPRCELLIYNNTGELT